MRRLLIASLVIAGCGERALSLPDCPASDYLTNPPGQLSGYCILQNQSGKVVPAAGVVPYDLNTPLFSDYALKTRMVWLPPGTSIEYDGENAFDMPVGSLIAKTFAFAKDERTPDADVRLVETRILMRTSNGWVGIPYVWNDAQDDATRETGGDTREIDFVDPQGTPRTAHYHVASEFECHTCHDSGEGIPEPLGPSARQLNRDFAYPTGTENQLAHWAKLSCRSGTTRRPAAPSCARAPISTGTARIATTPGGCRNRPTCG
jgi:uncharacterized repeat protein (TIGR03806 family)